jgi:hypothetical protein
VAPSMGGKTFFLKTPSCHICAESHCRAASDAPTLSFVR